MPKVSILVPIYNVSKYLVQCLDSVVGQTLKDIEIICINDGSTDNSLEIINSYAARDERIKVINKTNTGYGDSMNQGLALATGEYIGIIEPDDYAELNMFETLYDLAIANEADIAKSNFLKYFSLQHIDKKSTLIKKFAKGTFVQLPFVISKSMAIWSAIYRRSFLQQYKIDFLSTPGASYQDTGFIIKTAVMAKRIVLTPQAFLHYRQDNPNSSVKSLTKVWAIRDEYEDIFKFLANYKDVEEKARPLLIARQFEAYTWNYQRIDASFRDEFLKCFRQTFADYNAKGWLKNTTIKKENINILLEKPEEFLDHLDKQTFYCTPWQKIFSVKDTITKKYKVITFLGISIKFRNFN